MALFMVQSETLWPHDGAILMVSAMACERDSRTVKQVSIPVHGANPQRRPETPSPARRSPSTLWSASSRLPALGGTCSNAGHARPAFSRASAGPTTEPCRRAAEVLSLRRLFRSDRTRQGNNGTGCRGLSAMTVRDGINRLSNADTIPYGKTGWPWTGGHAPGDASLTALTTG